MATTKINSDISLIGKLKLNTLDSGTIGSYLGIDASNNTIILPTPSLIGHTHNNLKTVNANWTNDANDYLTGDNLMFTSSISYQKANMFPSAWSTNAIVSIGTYVDEAFAGAQIGIASAERTFNIRYKMYGVWSDWAKVWTSESLSLSSINNWNSAFGWGNHANAGYVPYVGANQTLNLNNQSLTNLNVLQINTTNPIPSTRIAGNIHFRNGNLVLDTSLPFWGNDGYKKLDGLTPDFSYRAIWDIPSSMATTNLISYQNGQSGVDTMRLISMPYIYGANASAYFGGMPVDMKSAAIMIHNGAGYNESYYKGLFAFDVNGNGFLGTWSYQTDQNSWAKIWTSAHISQAAIDWVNNNYNNTSGIQGVQGLAGLQGYQGNTGSQGMVGNQGYQGSNGYQGYMGVQGSNGTQGLQGITGNAGIQGYQGVTGIQGLQGLQGIIGTSGNQGLQGFAGNIGNQGYQGATGIQGYQGNTGYQGAIGQVGIQGSPGVQGLQGLQGIIGMQGYQGYVGYQGAAGNIGAQGVQGLIGFQGMQGLIGSQGMVGNQGYQGAAGNIGTQGVQGLIGFQGMQGITGNAGLQGYQGTNGIQGYQGYNGLQGIIGYQGVQGANGSTIDQWEDVYGYNYLSPNSPSYGSGNGIYTNGGYASKTQTVNGSGYFKIDNNVEHVIRIDFSSDNCDVEIPKPSDFLDRVIVITNNNSGTGAVNIVGESVYFGSLSIEVLNPVGYVAVNSYPYPYNISWMTIKSIDPDNTGNYTWYVVSSNMHI